MTPFWQKVFKPFLICEWCRTSNEDGISPQWFGIYVAFQGISGRRFWATSTTLHHLAPPCTTLHHFAQLDVHHLATFKACATQSNFLGLCFASFRKKRQFKRSKYVLTVTLAQNVLFGQNKQEAKDIIIDLLNIGELLKFPFLARL